MTVRTEKNPGAGREHSPTLHLGVWECSQLSLPLMSGKQSLLLNGEWGGHGP